MAVKEKRRGGAVDFTEMYIGYNRTQLSEMIARTKSQCEQHIEAERKKLDRIKKRGRKLAAFI